MTSEEILWTVVYNFHAGLYPACFGNHTNWLFFHLDDNGTAGSRAIVYCALLQQGRTLAISCFESKSTGVNVLNKEGSWRLFQF